MNVWDHVVPRYDTNGIARSQARNSDVARLRKLHRHGRRQRGRQPFRRLLPRWGGRR